LNLFFSQPCLLMICDCLNHGTWVERNLVFYETATPNISARKLVSHPKFIKAIIAS
jgi:hypothetical protein